MVWIVGDLFVWVKIVVGDVCRKVEPGLANGRFVRIVAGLSAGEEVSLSPPLSESVAGTDTKLVGAEKVETEE